METLKRWKKNCISTLMSLGRRKETCNRRKETCNDVLQGSTEAEHYFGPAFGQSGSSSLKLDDSSGISNVDNPVDDVCPRKSFTHAKKSQHVIPAVKCSVVEETAGCSLDVQSVSLSVKRKCGFFQKRQQEQTPSASNVCSLDKKLSSLKESSVGYLVIKVTGKEDEIIIQPPPRRRISPVKNPVTESKVSKPNVKFDYDCISVPGFSLEDIGTSQKRELPCTDKFKKVIASPEPRSFKNVSRVDQFCDSTKDATLKAKDSKVSSQRRELPCTNNSKKVLASPEPRTFVNVSEGSLFCDSLKDTTLKAKDLSRQDTYLRNKKHMLTSQRDLPCTNNFKKVIASPEPRYFVNVSEGNLFCDSPRSTALKGKDSNVSSQRRGVPCTNNFKEVIASPEPISFVNVSEGRLLCDSPKDTTLKAKDFNVNSQRKLLPFTDISKKVVASPEPRSLQNASEVSLFYDSVKDMTPKAKDCQRSFSTKENCDPAWEKPFQNTAALSTPTFKPFKAGAVNTVDTTNYRIEKDGFQQSVPPSTTENHDTESIIEMDEHSSIIHQGLSNMNCLYNQEGKLCTSACKRYINSTISGEATLVSIAVRGKHYVNAKGAFQVVWRGNAVIPLSEVKDGTNVMFDAVTSTDGKNLEAVIVWFVKKPNYIPLHSDTSLPSDSSYLFVSSRTLPFSSVMLNANKQHINIIYDGKKVAAMLSIDKMRQLKNLKGDNMFVRVNKMIKSGRKGCIEYFCDYVWDRSMLTHGRQTMQKLEVYKKASVGEFSILENISYLSTDVPGMLEISDGKCTLKCSHNEQEISANMPPRILDGVTRCSQQFIPVKIYIENCLKLNISSLYLVYMVEEHKVFFVPTLPKCYITLQSQNCASGKTSGTKEANVCFEAKPKEHLKLVGDSKVTSKVPKKSGCLMGITGCFESEKGDYIFLTVRGKFNRGAVEIAAFHRSVAFIHGSPLSGKPLPLQLEKNSEIWYCNLELHDKVINGVHVKYIAQLAWQGKKPLNINVSSKVKSDPPLPPAHGSSQVSFFALFCNIFICQYDAQTQSLTVLQSHLQELYRLSLY